MNLLFMKIVCKRDVTCEKLCVLDFIMRFIFLLLCIMPTDTKWMWCLRKNLKLCEKACEVKLYAKAQWNLKSGVTMCAYSSVFKNARFIHHAFHPHYKIQFLSFSHHNNNNKKKNSFFPHVNSVSSFTPFEMKNFLFLLFFLYYCV